MSSHNVEVHKFGGACFRTTSSFQLVLKILQNIEPPMIIVPSAFYGVTDSLHSLLKSTSASQISNEIADLKTFHLQILGGSASQNSLGQIDQLFIDLEKLIKGMVLTGETSSRMRDYVLSFGERLSSYILMLALKNLSPFLLDPVNVLRTNGVYYEASVQHEESKELVIQNLLPLLEKKKPIIIPGYYGGDKDGNVTLLGRSGTDYSAASIANLVEAKSLTIWKEVPAFMTADPKLIPNAKPLSFLDYDSTELLTHFGAKLIHPKALTPLRTKKIPLYVRNLYDPTNYTLISSSSDEQSILPVISIKKDLVLATIFFSSAKTASEFRKQLLKEFTNDGLPTYGLLLIGGKVIVAFERSHQTHFNNVAKMFPYLDLVYRDAAAIFAYGSSPSEFHDLEWFHDLWSIPLPDKRSFLIFISPERSLELGRSIHDHLLQANI
ncbi:MAG: hypothetical protein D6732_23995 [Methanobacteriota archaeon]|nr:MAG: hypothetical protein D6732_23995 [Euryarchaeota archaeon]